MNEPPAYLLHKLVLELDRAADNILRRQFGISYKRALFLLALQRQGTLTQHELAIRLGYSDPAVSAMLLQLTKDQYVVISISPVHKRKRLATITPKGSEIVNKGVRLLDDSYDQLMDAAGISAVQYNGLTEQLYRTLISKTKKEQT
jgi:DNA-binding MarR family transcriptional regulator